MDDEFEINQGFSDIFDVLANDIDGAGDGLTHAGLDATRARLAELRSDLDGVRMTCEDAALIESETRWVLDVLEFACDLGHARLELGAGQPLSRLDIK